MRGIPSLVLVEADTGNTISDKGRKLIDDHGAGGFPFTTERLEEAKKEAKEKKEASLKELADLKFLGTLSTMDEPDQGKAGLFPLKGVLKIYRNMDQVTGFSPIFLNLKKYFPPFCIENFYLCKNKVSSPHPVTLVHVPVII